MPYSEIHPVDRDDLCSQVKEMFGETTFKDLPLITLFNSGMGSGKSNIMATISAFLERWTDSLSKFNRIIYLLEKNQHLLRQIIKAFKAYKDKSIGVKRIELVEIDVERDISKIQYVLSQGKIPVVFMKNVAHSSGSLNKTAKLFERCAKAFQPYKQVTFVDELDNQLTSLSGGINAKLDHPRGAIQEYLKVASQKENSLNIFDIMRKYGVKCIGFSGTMNNMICSKLPSLGYKMSDISVINVHPIEALYKELKVVPLNVKQFDTIAPYLVEAEKQASKKILIAVPDENSITDFKSNYSRHFGKQISSTKITATNTKDRDTLEWKEEFNDAKYVFGISIITTGFDLSTWVNGQEFCLGILYRELSDAMSQPLSKNSEHDLHMESAASLMQLLARLRNGGIFLVPDNSSDRPLYKRLVDVFERIKNGVNEYSWVGGVPAETQAERYHQCLLIALVQNIKQHDRPVVDGILYDLKEMTGRDFKEEMLANIESPEKFDYTFWRGYIGCLWETYSVDHDIFVSQEEKKGKKAEIVSTYKRGLVSTGGGLRTERMYDDKVAAKVLERSDNRCGHCGEKFEEGDEPQDCHIKRHDSGGDRYTLDNIIRGHKSCDTMYDSDSFILYDPDRTHVWRRKWATNFKPHKKQLDGISQENLQARWKWEQDKQQMSHLTLTEFRSYLEVRGYTYTLIRTV
jgi:hypothetical protein